MELLVAIYLVGLGVLLLGFGKFSRYIQTIQENRPFHATSFYHKQVKSGNSSCSEAFNEENLEKELRRQRQRIARDLHDSVGSKLTYLVHSLDLLILDISRNGHITSQKQLEELCQSTRETMQVLRETVWVMHQPNLTVQQFVDHLRDYLNKHLSVWSHLYHELCTEGDLSVQLSSEQALNLFRIVQEAVTNVLRHAQASSLYIRIVSSSGEGLQIEILDNGCGFDPLVDQHGLGLDSLRQRTSELGGRIIINSLRQTSKFSKQEALVHPLPILLKVPCNWRTTIRVVVPFG